MADRDILPDNVKVTHYSLSLRDLDFKDWTYKGTVVIDAEIVKPTKELLINVLQLKLHNAKVAIDQNKSSQSLESTNFSYNDRAQRVAIAFDQELPASKKASFTIEFEGVMNDEMAGFSRSKYRTTESTAASVPKSGDFHYMFSTQFEACDARRAFPCFDEPNLKATFDFEIEVPTDLVALSNMPVKETKATKDGWNMVSFETTPIMSTYLLAWAVGEFEYIEAFTERRYNGKQLPVRVYATKGLNLKESGQLALQHATKIIDYFSEIFGIDHPLPKSDILTVHEFAQSAMENWGLVTYYTSSVLYDEKTSDPRQLNRIAYVVAHELAHQWFGNLVTMDWWDELWLNEGFATWVGWHAINHLHPEWEVWAQFVDEDMESAFRLDGLRAGHPIQVPVRDALDVNQIFDAISYLKGCSVIRMLANNLGTETFLKGVSNYLKAHAYGNAKTKALWDALSEASGKDVNAIMDPWISKIGHPVLTVTEEPGQISIKQSRYLSTGDVKAEDDTTTWWVPLGLEGKKGESGISTLNLSQKEDTIRDIDDSFYKLNSGANGFYRVNYPPARLAKLSTQLDKLSTEDKISIIGSTSDLALSGESTAPSVLSFLEGFTKETHPLVWSRILTTISLIKNVFNEDESIKKGMNAFTVKLIEPMLEKLGWEFPEGEDYLTGVLRKDLLTAAVSSKHEKTVTEALKRFNAWVENPEATTLNPSHRGLLWRAGLDDDAARTIKVLKKEWKESKALDGKMVTLSVMGTVQDPELIKTELLPFNFNKTPESDVVIISDMHIIGAYLARNVVGRSIQWEYMKRNWDACVAKLGNPVALERYIRVSLPMFTDEAMIDEIDDFFKDKDTDKFNRGLSTVKDKIRGRAGYKKRDAAALKEWLGSNGYL